MEEPPALVVPPALVLPPLLVLPPELEAPPEPPDALLVPPVAATPPDPPWPVLPPLLPPVPEAVLPLFVHEGNTRMPNTAPMSARRAKHSIRLLLDMGPFPAQPTREFAHRARL